MIVYFLVLNNKHILFNYNNILYKTIRIDIYQNRIGVN